MPNRPPRRSNLTEDQITSFQEAIFMGIPPHAWTDMETHARDNPQVRYMSRKLNPNIGFVLPYTTDEQKAAVKTLLNAMDAVLPAESFSYRFDHPEHTGKVVISLSKQHAASLNEIRAVHFDGALEQVFLRIHDDLKSPAFDEFIHLGSTNATERRVLAEAKRDTLNSLNLYRAEVSFLPRSDLVEQLTTFKDSLATVDEGDHLRGPLWLVKYSASQGRVEPEAAQRVLEVAEAFRQHASEAEKLAVSLQRLGVGPCRE